MEKNKEYTIVKNDKKVKEYKEDIFFNVVRGYLWTFLSMSGILGLAYASLKEANIFKLLGYGVLVSALSIPAIISFNNVGNIADEMNDYIYKELKKKQY